MDTLSLSVAEIQPRMSSDKPSSSLGASFPTSNSAPTAGLGCSASSSTVPAIIAHLPIFYRLALQLADLDELSYKEVADDLQMPLGTVRARCLLRRHYC